MTFLGICLIVLNIILLLPVVILIIMEVIQFFADGSDGIEKYLKKHKIPLPLEDISAICGVSLVLCIALSYINYRLGFFDSLKGVFSSTGNSVEVLYIVFYVLKIIALIILGLDILIFLLLGFNRKRQRAFYEKLKISSKTLDIIIKIAYSVMFVLYIVYMFFPSIFK